MHGRALRLAVVGKLLPQALEDRAGVRDGAPDRAEQLELHAPIPAFDLRLLAGVAAEQVRLRMQRLQVAADRDRFGEMRSVVELEHRHAA